MCEHVLSWSFGHHTGVRWSVYYRCPAFAGAPLLVGGFCHGTSTPEGFLGSGQPSDNVSAAQQLALARRIAITMENTYEWYCTPLKLSRTYFTFSSSGGGQTAVRDTPPPIHLVTVASALRNKPGPKVLISTAVTSSYIMMLELMMLGYPKCAPARREEKRREHFPQDRDLH